MLGTETSRDGRNERLTMARRSPPRRAQTSQSNSTASRLARIEATLERASDDREETNHKIDNLDSKFDAILAASGVTEGSHRALSQSVDSIGRIVKELTDADCGRRLQVIETWMPRIDDSIKQMDRPRELRKDDADLLADCVRGVKEYRDGRESRGKKMWQLVLTALGSGSVVGLLAKVFGH